MPTALRQNLTVTRVSFLFLLAGVVGLAAMQSPLHAEQAEDAEREVFEINWLSYEQGQQRAEETGTPRLISFQSTWCMSCAHIEKETYGREKVAGMMNDEFIPVRVYMDPDADEDELARVQALLDAYEVESLPRLVLVDPAEQTEHAAMQDLFDHERLLAWFDERLAAIEEAEDEDSEQA